MSIVDLLVVIVVTPAGTDSDTLMVVVVQGQPTVQQSAVILVEFEGEQLELAP